MRKPSLYVMLRKADGLTVTIRLKRIDGYTEDSVLGYAGYYDLSFQDKEILKKQEQYVFFTDNYRFEVIDGRRCVGQKYGSVGAVPIMPGNSTAPGENYAWLLRTHGLANAYRTLKGDKKLPLMMVIIVVVIVVALMAGVMYWRSMGDEVAVPETPIEIEAESVPQKVE